MIVHQPVCKNIKNLGKTGICLKLTKRMSTSTDPKSEICWGLRCETPPPIWSILQDKAQGMGKFLHAAGDWSLDAIRSLCVAILCTTFPQQKLTRGMKGSTWMTCSMAMELQCMSRPWKLLVTWSQLPIFFNEVDGSKYTGNFWCDKHHGDGVEAEIASL